jgi:Sugar phosphate permease
MLVALRFALGIGEGGAFPTATRAFTYWMPVAERGFAQGITHSFARLGGAVTPPLVLVVVAGGWRDAFILLGGASLAWTVLYLFVFTNSPEQNRRITPEETRKSATAPAIATAPSMRPRRGASWCAACGSSRSSTSAMAGCCGFI